jgi:PAS domain S-box-containing protein
VQGEACGGPDAHRRAEQCRCAAREPTNGVADAATKASSLDFEAILQVAVDALDAEVGVLSLWNEHRPAGGVLARSGPPDLQPTDLAAVLDSHASGAGEPLSFHIGPHGLGWTVLPLMVRHPRPEAILLLGRRGGCPERVSRASLAALSRVCALAFRDNLSRRTTALFDGLPAAVVVTDVSGRITQLNRRAERMFGYACAEVAGQPVDLLVPTHATAGLATGRRQNGETFSISVSLALVDVGGDLELAHVVRDASDEDDRLGKQEEFFVDISHELRTPAATIKTSAELLEDLLAPQLPVDLRQLLQNIEREAERLGTLVDDLLDLSSIRGGRGRLHPVKCDLRQVAVQAVDSIEPLARRHSQTVRLVVPDTPVDTVVDTDLLVRAVLNLVSNAQKYGRHGGRLEVRLESSPSEAVFVVEDDGPGIPDVDRERVFQRFYRSPTANGRRSQGSGLGLPLCRAAVELLGGRVWAEAGPSAGSVFKVALPLGLGSATPDVPV